MEACDGAIRRLAAISSVTEITRRPINKLKKTALESGIDNRMFSLEPSWREMAMQLAEKKILKAFL